MRVRVVPENVLISDKMATKEKTVRELNLEVEPLSERLRKLKEKYTTVNLDEDTKNKIEEVERLIKSNDEKIRNIDWFNWLLWSKFKLN